MRIIHTADWHLGQTFFGYDRTAEHTRFFDWLKAVVKEKKQNFIYLSKDAEEIESDIENKKIKSAKQIRALKFLIDNEKNDGEILSIDLQMFADVTNAVLKTLEKNGYIEIIEKEVERNPFIHKVVEKTQNLKLTQEQQEAFERVNASLQIGEYEEFLLFGVTGSREN